MGRKSTIGVVFNLGSRAVNWISKKQEIVALSSNKVEYITYSAACCQGIWLKKIIEECGMKYEEPLYRYCDNKSCIALPKTHCSMEEQSIWMLNSILLEIWWQKRRWFFSIVHRMSNWLM